MSLATSFMRATGVGIRWKSGWGKHSHLRRRKIADDDYEESGPTSDGYFAESVESSGPTPVPWCTRTWPVALSRSLTKSWKNFGRLRKVGRSSRPT
jgi:hypothetical protein